MIRGDLEDYSVDMRTILAKERTLLAEQRTQLSTAGIGLGLFATGFTLLKVFDDTALPFRIVESGFVFGGIILASLAVLHYLNVGNELKRIEKVEARLALEYHTDAARKEMSKFVRGRNGQEKEKRAMQ